MKHLLFLLVTALFISCNSGTAQSKIQTDKLMQDLRYLSSDELGGRGNSSKGNEAARNFIAERFAELELAPIFDTYEQPFSFKDRRNKKSDLQGVNVVGSIKGKVAKKMIITAHYDHLGTRDGKIFNGADDNASGVAAIMAIAEYYSKNTPNHTIVFIAFDAEELGLQGAKFFVDNLPFPKDQIALNVNLDMVGRDDNNRLYAAGGSHYPELKKVLEEVSKTSPVKLMLGNDLPSDGHNNWTSSSDHGPFHKKKIPFVYFGVEDHPDYHKDTDTADKIKPAFFTSTVNTILQFTEAMDQTIQ